MARILFMMTGSAQARLDRRQFRRQAPALAAAGHEVIFVAGEPGQEAKKSFAFSVLPEKKRRWVRKVGGLNLFNWVRRLQPQAIIIPNIENLPLGIALKLFTRIRVFYDCREDMYNSMLYSKVRFPKLLRRILAECTRFTQFLACKTFDGLITADPATAQLHRAMPEDRKMVFYNTALLSRFTDDYPPLAQREYDFVLLGGMSPRSGMLVLLDALEELIRQGRQFRIMLLGQPEPVEAQRIEQFVAKHELGDRLHVTGRLPHAAVRDQLIRCKVGLVMLTDCPKFHHNIACKAFEYMACGMPVISSDLPPERLFIEEEATGLFFAPGDAVGAAAAMARLLDDPQLAENMGRQGRLDAEEKWNCERDQENLRNFVDRLLI